MTDNQSKACDTPKCMPIITWKSRYLVSNRDNIAAHIDTDLNNPWDIVISGKELWTTDNVSDSITNYDFFGNKMSGTINIRQNAHNVSYPTGLVLNCTGGFPMTFNNQTETCRAIACTEQGQIVGYNPKISPLQTQVIQNRSLAGNHTCYKGMAMLNNKLYIADFMFGEIHVYDDLFAPLSGYPFVDGCLHDPMPSDYGPNNIVAIGCYLFVLYARKNPTVNLESLSGPGNGYINIFTPDGIFIKRFASRGYLNSPWALIPAPPINGFLKDSFLVGNHGDGRIHVYDSHGNWCGPLLNQNVVPLVIPGLRGLTAYYAEKHIEIFFTAAANQRNDGIIGSLVIDKIC